MMMVILIAMIMAVVIMMIFDYYCDGLQMKAAIRSARNIFLVSLVLSLPVVVVSMGFRDEKGGGLGEGK